MIHCSVVIHHMYAAPLCVPRYYPCPCSCSHASINDLFEVSLECLLHHCHCIYNHTMEDTIFGNGSEYALSCE